MATERECEHCGVEAKTLPTPEGFHCETCYDQVMGQTEEEGYSAECSTDAHAD